MQEALRKADGKTKTLGQEACVPREETRASRPPLRLPHGPGSPGVRAQAVLHVGPTSPGGASPLRGERYIACDWISQQVYQSKILNT